MGRNQLEYIATTCRDGINQREDKRTSEQCADALNVWAPNRTVEQRPGYISVSSTIVFTNEQTGPPQGAPSLVSEDVSAGTFDVPAGGFFVLSDLVGRTASVAGDRWYIGNADIFYSARLSVLSINSNETIAEAQYYNGTNWVGLTVLEVSNSNGSKTDHHLDEATVFLQFTAPGDWTAVDVNGTTNYWLRFTLVGADLDSLVRLSDTGSIVYTDTDLFNTRGLLVGQFSAAKRYFVIAATDIADELHFQNMNSLQLTDNLRIITTLSDFPGGVVDEPPTIAVVPQFDEAYIAYNNFVTIHNGYKDSSLAIADLLVNVEHRDFAVGVGAPYNPTTQIAQEGEWPRAKYMMFFKGHLWAAGLLAAPFTVRWSAPSPYHRVWPNLNFEVLMENDNSPITGLSNLGEYPVVFKQDSVWVMDDAGISDAFGLQLYSPRKVVDGVGCVSNSSIAEVQGRLIFLAEDGVYAFDGTPNIEKLSDTIQNSIDSIAASRRRFSVAVNWKVKNHYLLAFSTTGDASGANDKVVVWDYNNSTPGRNIWWIWDNVDAQHWLSDEGAGDNETLYFSDSQGSIFQMDRGRTDNGAAISSSVTTRRLLEESWARKLLRYIRVSATNKTRSLTVTPLPDDAPTGDAATIDFTDPVEKDWGTLQWGGGGTEGTDDNYTTTRRYRRKNGQKVAFDHMQIKVAHSVKNQKFSMSKLELLFKTLGRR